MDGTGIDAPAIPEGAPAPLVIVTGAGGFIGRHVVRGLLAAGYRVRAVTRGAVDATVDIAAHPGTDGNADWRPLLTDAHAVVHLAGMAHLPLDTRETRRRLRTINVVSTQRLAEACAAAGVSNFVFMSSIKAVSDHSDDTPLTEASPTRPGDCYGAAKLAAERRLQRIGRNSPATRMLILRPPLVYGPGVGANFAAFARLVLHGLPLPLAGIRNRRSLIYVGNLVDAVVRCLQSPDVAAGIYHLSDGPGISTPELAQAIAAARHRRARLFRVPMSWLTSMAGITGRQAQLSRVTGSLDVSSSHFRRSFGWHPPFTLAEGLRATLREPTRNAAGAPSGDQASA